MIDKHAMNVEPEAVPIIIDNGSSSCKAGFAGDDLPRVVPTLTGRSIHDVTDGLQEKNFYVGDEARAKRETLRLRYPIEHGIISSWDDIELFWNHIFKNELKVSPEEHPIMLTEPPHNPQIVREKMTEIMFEKFNTPALNVTMTGILSLYSTGGRTTGLVLEAGECVTHAIKIYQGYSQYVRHDRIDFAGRDLTSYLQKLLQEKGHMSCVNIDVIRDMKETFCYVAQDFPSELSSCSSLENSYELPDGTSVTLGDERFRCAEGLFHPTMAGSEFPGIHEIIQNAVTKADVGIHGDFFGNIVLSGGTTMFPGIQARLQKELDATVSSKVNVIAPANRKYSVWIGGSILASHSSFEKLWISRGDYDEYGPTVCIRKL